MAPPADMHRGRACLQVCDKVHLALCHAFIVPLVDAASDRRQRIS
jgi:hypothetical protein